MEINKKHIIIGFAVLVIVILLMSFLFKPETQDVVNDDLFEALQNYQYLTDYDQKTTVWRELLKTCPYWKAYVSAKYTSGKYDRDIKYGLTIDSLTTRLARELVERNENILEAYNLCSEIPYPTEFR